MDRRQRETRAPTKCALTESGVWSQHDEWHGVPLGAVVSVLCRYRRCDGNGTSDTCWAGLVDRGGEGECTYTATSVVRAGGW
jgi:hypothetical protein